MPVAIPWPRRILWNRSYTSSLLYVHFAFAVFGMFAGAGVATVVGYGLGFIVSNMGYGAIFCAGDNCLCRDPEVVCNFSISISPVGQATHPAGQRIHFLGIPISERALLLHRFWLMLLGILASAWVSSSSSVVCAIRETGRGGRGAGYPRNV